MLDMRYKIVGLAALSLTAITGCRRPSPQALSTRGPVTACAATTPYVVLNGADTVGVSWNTVTDFTFDATVHAVSQGALLRFSGRRSPAGDVERMNVRIWHNIADSAAVPTQQATVEFRPGEVVSVVSAPARGSQTQRDPVPPGSLPYMANVPLLLELIQRRVPRGAAAPVQVPVLWLFTGGEMDRVQVSQPAPDSVVLRFELTEYRLRRSADGAIAGGTGRALQDSTADRTRIVRPGCR